MVIAMLLGKPFTLTETELPAVVVDGETDTLGLFDIRAAVRSVGGTNRAISATKPTAIRKVFSGFRTPFCSATSPPLSYFLLHVVSAPSGG